LLSDCFTVYFVAAGRLARPVFFDTYGFRQTRIHFSHGIVRARIVPYPGSLAWNKSLAGAGNSAWGGSKKWKLRAVEAK
jgi:hypothetical protein